MIIPWIKSQTRNIHEWYQLDLVVKVDDWVLADVHRNLNVTIKE